jgi:hypothetical protein
MVPADTGEDADLAGISASNEHRLGIPHLQAMMLFIVQVLTAILLCLVIFALSIQLFS